MLNTTIQTKNGPRTLADIAGPYCVLRGWRDGESMMPHLIMSGQVSPEQCRAKMRYGTGSVFGGGYIVRVRDGAQMVDSNWIDDNGNVID